MTVKGKIMLSAVGACLVWATCLAILATFHDRAEWFGSLFLFPLSHFVLMSIVFFIGDVKGLFDYTWALHFAQFAIYGGIFAYLWLRNTPRKAATLLLITHFAMIFIYIGFGLLWDYSRT